MNESNSRKDFFERLAERAPLDDAERAPARLKSLIYSRLVRRQAESGPLMSLAKCGPELCVFEKTVAIAPLSEKLKQLNPCSVCHARLLAEHLERPPIYWKHCPYVGFQNR